MEKSEEKVEHDLEKCNHAVDVTYIKKHNQPVKNLDLTRNLSPNSNLSPNHDHFQMESIVDKKGSKFANSSKKLFLPHFAKKCDVNEV